MKENTDFNNICFLKRNTELTEQFDFLVPLDDYQLIIIGHIYTPLRMKNAWTLHAAEM